MRTFHKIESITGTLANLVFLAIFVGLFILVFFYPETAGELIGKIVSSFNAILKAKQI